MKKAVVFGFLGLLASNVSAVENKYFIDSSVWNLPLNKITQVACHNCYENQHAPSLSNALASVRTLEIDFYDDFNFHYGDSTPGAWFVRHNLNGGNDNNCNGGDGNLEACLNDVKNWSNNNPGHFPLTIILDKKQGFGNDRTPTDLDNLVSRVFGSKLYTPANLMSHTGYNNLRYGVERNGWPTANSLQGKILLVLNGTRNEWLDEYADERRNNARIFISPATNETSDITGTVSGLSNLASSYVVMNNMSEGNRKYSRQVYNANHIGRVWGNDDQSFNQQLAHGTHLSAYYNYAGQYAGLSKRIRPFASSIDSPVLVSYSEPNLNGNIVCTLELDYSFAINLKNDSRCDNDEIQSVSIINMKSQQTVRLFDSPTGSYGDDYYLIQSTGSANGWRNINNLHQNYYSYPVTGTYYRDNGLSGKVSRIQFSK